jgi:hypothetical protein
MVPAPVAAPPFRVKLLFWLLLGALSVILAEVVSFSSPFAFFDLWGLLVVYPLYTVHVLVLAYIIFRRHRVTLHSLLLAGAILGMYEAYLTKVLWSPTWGEMPWVMGGLYLGQTAILVLFWHPLMAFALPVVVAENAFTSTTETADLLPGLIQKVRQSPRGRWLLVAGFALFCALPAATNAPSPAVALLSAAAASVFFGGLCLLWWRLAQRQGYTFRSLLPNSREAAVLIGLLLVVYLWQGAFIRPEALPRTVGPHLTVWAIYLVLFGLLYLNVRRAPRYAALEAVGAHPLPWRSLLLFAIVYGLASALGVLVKPVAFIGVITFWALCPSLGLVVLVQAILIAIGVKRNEKLDSADHL